MIADPARRGQQVAAFFAAVSPRLFQDIEEAGVLDSESAEARSRARIEWECFALYACVRGLVAAGGFNRETGQAIDAFHESVLAAVVETEGTAGDLERRRAVLSRRYTEYGAIGQEGGASGAATVAQRLGLAAARHMAETETPAQNLAELVGALHEAIAEGAAEAVRRME